MIDFDALVAPKGVGRKSDQSHSPHAAWGWKPAVAKSRELDRVLNLDRRALELDGTERAETITDMITERFARPVIPGRRCKCPDEDLFGDRHANDGCITRLRLVQALALREIGIIGGLLGPIGVGHGKTLVDLLAPLAFRVFDPKLSTFVLLVPPGLVVQLIGDYEYIGQHFKMPQLIVHGTSYANTTQKMNSVVTLERGAPVLHVVPYSRLMRPEATVWLSDRLKPDVIIADEAHKLRNIKSATGNRVWSYMESVAPNTRFVGLSGSITSKSIEDYWHLAKWALRENSPLPIVDYVKDDWKRALDPVDNPADPGSLIELCNPGERLLDGFRRRVIETLGVVSTATPAVDCELRLQERPAPPIPQDIKDALKMVRGELPDQDGPQRPDGEQLVDSLSQFRTAMQIACGFYYKFIYPRCEFPRDTKLVEDWIAYRKDWFCEVRQKLKTLEEHLDSPRLVQNAAERALGIRPQHKGLPVWKSKYFAAWHKHKNDVMYETQTVRLNDYLVRDAIAWGNENRGIIWYEHGAFGEWMSELSGLPIFGGGKEAKERLLGNPAKGLVGERGDRSIICSIKAHGTGTNGLQRVFSRALMFPMSDPTGWEQVLGRLHRINQKADSVVYDFYRHTNELKKHIDSALAAAVYVQHVQGVQKIVQAFGVA